MTLSNDSDDHLSTKADSLDGSSWNALYCSHLWKDSNLRKAAIKGSYSDNRVIKYCYTCRGKIRKYEIKSSGDFFPNIHSTPNEKIERKDHENPTRGPAENSFAAISQDGSSNDLHLKDISPTNGEINRCIPTISRQIDTSFRQKYTSYEMRPNEINQRRLRKSLKGIGCIVNLALSDSPLKKRTQIQACSISVMIVAIIVISFVLVNFTTPNFTRANTVASTIVVPTNNVIEFNKPPTGTTNDYSSSTVLDPLIEVSTAPATVQPFMTSTENISLISSILTKIRKNVRTFPKETNKQSLKPKDIINRDLSQRFCSCQTDEVCMLDENSGTSICREAVDIDDPTGCGGLCALETEACQLVDRVRGVRVCRLLTLVTCSPQEWRCRNGLCVKAEHRCDGSIQCYDRSDEMHCECDLTRQFRCGHSISCFSNTKLCDGIIDCWDGLDELNCTTECPKDQFTCTDGQCIMSSRFCDSFADCADGSDEPHGCDAACGAHEMRCNNRRCVPNASRCDGHDHCGDASDEMHCS